MSRLEDYTLVSRCSFIHDYPACRSSKQLSIVSSDVATLIATELHIGSDLSRPVALLATFVTLGAIGINLEECLS